MWRALLSALGAFWLFTGCGVNAAFHMTGTDWKSFVQARGGGSPGSDLSALQFKPGLCDGEELRQDFGQLDPSAFVSFLTRQGLDVRFEQQREDLTYAHVSGAGATTPLRMRVAVLKDADAAGRELSEAIEQHGKGAWGVHRANLAILGPLGRQEDVLAFVARSKLACWGVVTLSDGDDAYVIPGGYLEL